MVGTHLVYDLLLKGYRVKALKRQQSNTMQVRKTFAYYSDNKTANLLYKNIEWVDGDILDFESILEAADGCTQAYHTAAVVSFSRADRKEMMNINVGGTANIINVCLEKKIPLCHVSSIAALGRSSEPDGLITENDSWQTDRGRSAYSISKHKSEMEVWRGIAEGLQAVIVNPAVVLGAGDWTKSSLKFFSQIHKGLRFHTPGITGFVDARDVSRCMIQLMEQQRFGERFILSAGNLSYRELFFQIADNLKVKRPSKAAKPWMLNIAWRIATVIAAITGKKPFLSKETAHSAFQQIRYNSEKIGYEFVPLDKCIEDCCRIFMK